MLSKSRRFVFTLAQPVAPPLHGGGGGGGEGGADQGQAHGGGLGEACVCLRVARSVFRVPRSSSFLLLLFLTNRKCDMFMEHTCFGQTVSLMSVFWLKTYEPNDTLFL